MGVSDVFLKNSFKRMGSPDLKAYDSEFVQNRSPSIDFSLQYSSVGKTGSNLTLTVRFSSSRPNVSFSLIFKRRLGLGPSVNILSTGRLETNSSYTSAV